MDIPKIDLKALVRLPRVSRLCEDLSRLLSLDVQIFNNRGEVFYRSDLRRPDCVGAAGRAEACAITFEDACRAVLAGGRA
ncbi:MAG: hypothetical protein K8I02_06575, partial [Candidatus Methylomirabilis sp.]|nr:hypothetical protein [Deltaproteobacteria bacterium]